MQAIRGTGYDYGFDLKIFEADFNQIDRQIFDPNSELYLFEPEIILVFESSHKLLQKYNEKSVDEIEKYSKCRLAARDFLSFSGLPVSPEKS